MDQAALAASAYEDAQRAFDAGNYETALACGDRLRSLASQVAVVADNEAPSRPRFSIIIVLYGRQPDLAAALSRLVHHAGNGDYELIFVDNGAQGAREIVSGLIHRYRWINAGFNSGCSGGRNLGAQSARGEYLIFLDDDGITQQNAVERLVETITAYEAVAVRGRVFPKSEGGHVGSHYDPGDEILYSVPDAEGISIWRRREFVDYGGFDILLAGREGLALWSKMYRSYGPDAFLYTPEAVLLHDYAKDSANLETKKDRLVQSERYLAHYYPHAIETRSMIYGCRRRLGTRALFQRARYQIGILPRLPAASAERLSVLTFANGPAQHLEDYTKSFKSQTHSDFEIVFAHDASSSDAADQMSALWHGDDRLRLVNSSGTASSLLNTALAHASNDICVIAKIHDISHPLRLELISRYFRSEKSSGCLGFASFNEDSLHEIPSQLSPATIGIKTRSLLGMPVSFPAFAFRKSQFELPFGSSHSDGFACSWIHQNLRHRGIDGVIIPLNQVFHRQSLKKVEREESSVEFNFVVLAHEELLGPLSDSEKSCCRMLLGWDVPTVHAHVSTVEEYILRLIVSNARLSIYDQFEIEQFLLQRVSQIRHEFILSRNEKYKSEREKYKREQADLRPSSTVSAFRRYVSSLISHR